MVIVKKLRWFLALVSSGFLCVMSYPLYAGYYIVYNAPAVVEVCCTKPVSHTPYSTHTPRVKRHAPVAQEKARTRVAHARTSSYTLTVSYPTPPCPDRSIHPVSVRSTGQNQMGIIYQFTPADSLPPAEMVDNTSRGVVTDMATMDDVE